MDKKELSDDEVEIKINNDLFQSIKNQICEVLNIDVKSLYPINTMEWDNKTRRFTLPCWHELNFGDEIIITEGEKKIKITVEKNHAYEEEKKHIEQLIKKEFFDEDDKF